MQKENNYLSHSRGAALGLVFQLIFSTSRLESKAQIC